MITKNNVGLVLKKIRQWNNEECIVITIIISARNFPDLQQNGSSVILSQRKALT